MTNKQPIHIQRMCVEQAQLTAQLIVYNCIYRKCMDKKKNITKNLMLEFLYSHDKNHCGSYKECTQKFT